MAEVAGERVRARRRRRSRWLRWPLAAVGAYAAVCALAFAFQDRLVYFPGPPPTTTPADRGVAFEELWLPVDGGERVHAWWLSAGGDAERTSERGAVVFCHGNAGTIEHRVDAARPFLELGLDVLLFDYRGYGASDGAPGEEGTYADARAAWEHAVHARGVPPGRVVAFGRSLGGAVAVDLAARREVGALVVESTFTALPEVGAAEYPFLPVRWLSRLRYDSAAKIGVVDAPVLVAHSPDDEIVPFELGRELFELAPEPRTFVRTAGGHNGLGYRGRPEWREAVAAFLADALGRD